MALDWHMPERDFQETIEHFCAVRGLLWMSVVDSRGQHAEGWPDLAIADVPHGTLRLWELKSARGRLRPAQTAWLDALAHCTRLESGVYRPSDWDRVSATLVG
jgi:hypothetical protein